MIAKTTSAHYNPYEYGEREELVDKLSKTVGKTGTGGFAGSDIRTGGLSSADRAYRGGYEDILKNIAQLKGSSLDSVMNTIYGWKELVGDSGTMT